MADFPDFVEKIAEEFINELVGKASEEIEQFLVEKGIANEEKARNFALALSDIEDGLAQYLVEKVADNFPGKKVLVVHPASIPSPRDEGEV